MSSQASEDIPVTQIREIEKQWFSAQSFNFGMSNRECGFTPLIPLWNLLLFRLMLKVKRLTNHKLKATSQSHSAIIGITGHTNERSLSGYKSRKVMRTNNGRFPQSYAQTVRQGCLANVVFFKILAFSLLWKTWSSWWMKSNWWQFSWLSSDHELPSWPKVSQAESISDDY